MEGPSVREPSRLVALLVATPLVILVATTAAQAGFVASVSGQAQVIAAPASSAPGALTANELQVWDESSGKLSSSLSLDLGGTLGNYDGLTNYTSLGVTLPKGTAYDSVMIQLDPTSPYSTQPVMGSITFTNKIIGVALFGPSLNSSDIYGFPKTIYPTGLPNLFLQTRGIDYTHSDRLSISNNGMTLTLQLPANYGMFDQIRVFTAASGAPEPASLFVWSTMGLMVFGRKLPKRWLRSRGIARSNASNAGSDNFGKICRSGT
jgi:hypothetical protein